MQRAAALVDVLPLKLLMSSSKARFAAMTTTTICVYDRSVCITVTQFVVGIFLMDQAVAALE